MIDSRSPGAVRPSTKDNETNEANNKVLKKDRRSFVRFRYKQGRLCILLVIDTRIW